MAKFIYGFLLIVTYSIVIVYRNDVNLNSLFENIKKNTNYIYVKVENYINKEKEFLTKEFLTKENKEYKRVEDFEINFEGDIKFSFNEKTNKIDRYIYLNKQWILLKR